MGLDSLEKIHTYLHNRGWFFLNHKLNSILNYKQITNFSTVQLKILRIAILYFSILLLFYYCRWCNALKSCFLGVISCTLTLCYPDNKYKVKTHTRLNISVGIWSDQFWPLLLSKKHALIIITNSEFCILFLMFLGSSSFIFFEIINVPIYKIPIINSNNSVKKNCNRL